ncbi:hypothetical protein Patl1_37527 [Pistacia atlantica]|nr:hypothetical protein Patl1_37527 [Pistacia atlantica]
MVDIMGKSRNIDLFWDVLQEMGQLRLVNDKTFKIALKTLAEVVEIFCSRKLLVEAKYLVLKLNEWIKPNGITYGQMMRVKRMDELGLSTYRLVINWMCKRGKISQAYVMFEEMLKRGTEADNLTLSYVIYGLLARGKVREAYKVVGAVEKPDISVYHGLIKGLLKLRRASEATQVFREMIKRGCEPTMHTYIMLLQGHLGKRGRKGVDPLVNFDTIFVGGLVKAGKLLEATKYVERGMNRVDYNKFLHYYSNEEGVAMFEEVGKKLRDVGLVDLVDILKRHSILHYLSHALSFRVSRAMIRKPKSTDDLDCFKGMHMYVLCGDVELIACGNWQMMCGAEPKSTDDLDCFKGMHKLSGYWKD